MGNIAQGNVEKLICIGELAVVL